MVRFERERNNLERRLRPASTVMMVIAIAVIMIMSIAAARQESLLALLLLCEFEKLGWCYLPFGDLNHLKGKADDLLLVDRCPQLVERSRILPVELEHLPFLSGKLAGAVDHGSAQLLIGNANL